MHKRAKMTNKIFELKLVVPVAAFFKKETWHTHKRARERERVGKQCIKFCRSATVSCGLSLFAYTVHARHSGRRRKKCPVLAGFNAKRGGEEKS